MSTRRPKPISRLMGGRNDQPSWTARSPRNRLRIDFGTAVRADAEETVALLQRMMLGDASMMRRYCLVFAAA